MEKSHFASLPAELRNNIYRLVLCDEAPIVVECQTATYQGVPRKYHFLPGLLMTCRQVREEGAQMFSAGNTFQLQIQPTLATEVLRLCQDDGRHLWEFLHHMDHLSLPAPANLIVRISRCYSGISARADRSNYGREIACQLFEVQQLATKSRIPNVVCRLEASWGEGIEETGDIQCSDVVSSARAEMLSLERKSGLTHFPRSPWGMSASFLWGNLHYVQAKYAYIHDVLTTSGPKGLALVT